MEVPSNTVKSTVEDKNPLPLPDALRKLAASLDSEKEESLRKSLKLLESVAQIEDATHRTQLSKAFRDLSISLENKNDTLHRVAYGPFELSVVKIVVDTKIFESLLKPERPQTAEELASTTGVDSVLMIRLLRFLASHRFIREVGKNTYIATHITKALTLPGINDGVFFQFDFYGPLAQQLPGFLKETHYQNPQGQPDSLLYKALKIKDQTPFEWAQMKEQEELLKHWMTFVVNWHTGKVVDSDYFADMSKRCEAWPANKAVFVDISGSDGSECITFLLAAKDVTWRVVLQYLETTLTHATEDSRVEKQAIDFFKGQPEKGAKFYYLRNVLHDWSDEHSLVILKHIKDSMTEDSTLMINEIIIPSVDAHYQVAQIDMALMMAVGSMERSEKDWDQLLKDAGLEIVSKKTWAPTTGDSIIEAKLPRKQ